MAGPIVRRQRDVARLQLFHPVLAHRRARPHRGRQSGGHCPVVRGGPRPGAAGESPAHVLALYGGDVPVELRAHHRGRRPGAHLPPLQRHRRRPPQLRLGAAGAAQRLDRAAGVHACRPGAGRRVAGTGRPHPSGGGNGSAHIAGPRFDTGAGGQPAVRPMGQQAPRLGPLRERAAHRHRRAADQTPRHRPGADNRLRLPGGDADRGRLRSQGGGDQRAGADRADGVHPRSAHHPGAAHRAGGTRPAGGRAGAAPRRSGRYRRAGHRHGGCCCTSSLWPAAWWGCLRWCSAAAIGKGSHALDMGADQTHPGWHLELNPS